MATQTNSLVSAGLARPQRAAAQPAHRPHRGGPAPGGPGRGRELPRRRAQGLRLHRLQRRSRPVPWAQHLRQPGPLTSTYGVIGPCGALDQVLNQVLGPRPAARCDAQTGPAARCSGTNASAGTPLPPDRQAPRPRGHRHRRAAPSAATAVGPNSGLGGLSQLLSPLLQGVEVMDALPTSCRSKVVPVRRGRRGGRRRRDRRRPGHQGRRRPTRSAPSTPSAPGPVPRRRRRRARRQGGHRDHGARTWATRSTSAWQ